MDGLHLRAMNKLLLLFTLIAVHTSEASERLIKNELEAFGACYLPTHSDVSYSSVIELPTDSPSEVISYGKAALQYGELWLPKGIPEDKPAPLVVFIHGGCWLNEYNIKHTHAFSTALAQAGYAVWSVEYRRTGDEGGGWPGSFEDVQSAINFTTTLKDYGVDTRKTVVTGHSAGGHLALLAGAKNSAIHSIIGLAAITNIEQYANGDNSCQLATPKFMGGTPNEIPTQYEVANPSTQNRHANIVLIHGDADKIVPLQQARDFSNEVRVINGAGHFDLIHPGTPAFKRLLEELAKQTQ